MWQITHTDLLIPRETLERMYAYINSENHALRHQRYIWLNVPAPLHQRTLEGHLEEARDHQRETNALIMHISPREPLPYHSAFQNNTFIDRDEHIRSGRQNRGKYYLSTILTKITNPMRNTNRSV